MGVDNRVVMHEGMPVTTLKEALTRQGEILVVEDTPSSLKLLSDLLVQAGYAVRQAPSGELALWTVETSLPDLILLDINMPGLDGFEVCRRLKANPRSCDVPVVFLSAHFDPQSIVHGLDMGAVDYIAKPYVAEEVLARVRAHVALARALRDLDEERETLERRVQERTGNLEMALAKLQSEVEARQAVEENLRLAGKVFAASFDGLLVMDPQGVIQMANPAFSRLAGYAAQEIAGQVFSVLDTDKNPAGCFAQLWQTLAEQGVWSGELWLRHQDGNVFPAMVTVFHVRDDDELVTHVGAAIVGIAERKDAETLIQFLSRHDALTGLPNRAKAAAYFDQLLACCDLDNEAVAVLCVDLDRFKGINDVFGHPVGDRVLQMVSDRLGECLLPGDIAYRQGADEFIILRVDRQDLRPTREFIQKLLRVLDTEFELEEGRIAVSASIGVATSPCGQADLNELVRNAGSALSLAKAKGGHDFAFFSDQMDAQARQSLELEIRLKDALALGQFEVFYQPQVALAHGDIIGAEALLRWHDPERGFISPAQFIPVAEESGQIVAIGDWVLRRVCADIQRWRQQGLPVPRIAVNVSARQFMQDNLVDRVAGALAEHALPPDCLEVEITEGAVVHDVARGIDVLQRLRALGVSVAIDDFGTGYSSLAYLKRFPLDLLKIDQSFVRDMTRDEASRAIALSIISLAHNLRLKVIAEGVETQEEAALLRQHGCDQIQGYLFSKPVTENAWVALLQAGAHLEVEAV